MNIISIYEVRFNVQIMKINKIKKKEFLFALTPPNVNMISIPIYKNKIKKEQFLSAFTFPNMNIISISIYKEI